MICSDIKGERTIPFHFIPVLVPPIPLALTAQFYDLLNIFEMNGLPSDSNPYLFNGDFVDRGSFSVECIFTLLAFKCLYPNGEPAVHIHPDSPSRQSSTSKSRMVSPHCALCIDKRAKKTQRR